MGGIEKDTWGARGGKGSGGNDLNRVLKHKIFKSVLNQIENKQTVHADNSKCHGLRANRNSFTISWTREQYIHFGRHFDNSF